VNKFQLAGLVWLCWGFIFLAWGFYGLAASNWTVYACGFAFWVACLLIARHLYQKGGTYAEHS